MHTRVGPTGARELNGMPDHSFDGGGQHAAYGAHPGLDGEAPKVGAEVGNDQGDWNRWALKDRGVVAEKGQNR
jgi:hypothetical protein